MAEPVKKKKERKPTQQISVNLVEDVAKAFAATRLRRGTTKTRMAIGGLLAFHLLDDVIQRRIMDWASLLDEQLCEWEDAFEWSRQEAGKWAQVYESAIEKAIEREVGIAAGKPAKRVSGRR